MSEANENGDDIFGIESGRAPRELEKGLVKIKLFFEGAAESQYAELFANIDLKARRLNLAEKDPEYRPAIIRALRGR